MYDTCILIIRGKKQFNQLSGQDLSDKEISKLNTGCFTRLINLSEGWRVQIYLIECVCLAYVRIFRPISSLVGKHQQVKDETYCFCSTRRRRPCLPHVKSTFWPCVTYSVILITTPGKQIYKHQKITNFGPKTIGYFVFRVEEVYRAMRRGAQQFIVRRIYFSCGNIPLSALNTQYTIFDAHHWK